MRFFDRSRVEAPACLAQYPPGSPWKQLTPDHRDELRRALDAIRGPRCAYCDCDLTEQRKAPHLEHFVQRSRAPQRTFDWSNIFWSCSKQDSCGKHKDAKAGPYEDACLLQPDRRDPRPLLHFSQDGRVRPRLGLSDADRRIAETTIRVFNLDAERLRTMRRAYLAGFLPEALALADYTLEETAAYLDLELPFYDSQPFSAAILDLFGIGP